MVSIYTTLLTIVEMTKQRLRHDDEGATAVEYGLMVALIAGAIVGIVFILGQTLGGIFSGVTAKISNP